MRQSFDADDLPRHDDEKHNDKGYHERSGDMLERNAEALIFLYSGEKRAHGFIRALQFAKEWRL